MSKTNFEQLIELLLQIPKKRGTFRFPYTDRRVHPPRKGSFKVTLTEQDAQDILTIIKRAANKQRLDHGDDVLFTAPIDYPDPDAEIKRRMSKFISDMLVEAEQLDDAAEKRKLLKEIRMAAKELRPNVNMSKYEWDRLVKAFRKVNPELSEDEILHILNGKGG